MSGARQPASPDALTVTGAPLSARLAALYLLRRRPELAIHLRIDSAAPWLAEGAVMVLSGGPTGWGAALAPLITTEWPGFLTVTPRGRTHHAVAIGLIDPLQCEAELSSFEAWMVPAPSDDATFLELPPLGEPLHPSSILQAEFTQSLELPVLYEEVPGEDTFAQYLPLGGGATMVRHFACNGASDPVDTLFGAQHALMELLARFDR